MPSLQPAALLPLAAALLSACGAPSPGTSPPATTDAPVPGSAPAAAATPTPPQDTAEQRRTRVIAEMRLRQQSMPRFEDFPARDTFTGTPAPVDLASAEGARRFRTVLRGAAANGPNFAGHYAVVMWGCGTSCQSYAIVDARTGRVTFGPEAVSAEVAYRLDSELLIANPPENWLDAYGTEAADVFGGTAMSIYYRWDGRRLIPLDSLAIGANATPPNPAHD